MKNKNLFDMLENTEDELMDDFTGLCPEMDEERFEKLFAKSERDYKIKKEKIKRTAESYNTESDNTVHGVERINRPEWLRPVMMAASFVLIAGVVAGSTIMLRKNKWVTEVGTQSSVTATEDSTEETSETTEATEDTTVTEETQPVSQKEMIDGSEVENITIKDQWKDMINEKIIAADDLVTIQQGYTTLDYNNYIEFAADPSLDWNGPIPSDMRESQKDRLYYIHVKNESFESIGDLRERLRGSYTDNYIDNLKDFYTNSNYYTDWFGSGFDDLNEGDMTDKTYIYVEYRGELYVNSYIKSCAVSSGCGESSLIVANETETSFTVFIPKESPNDFAYDNSFCIKPEYGIDDFYCEEVRFVLDPEFNDWRIDARIPHDPGVYGQLYKRATE